MFSARMRVFTVVRQVWLIWFAIYFTLFEGKLTERSGSVSEKRGFRKSGSSSQGHGLSLLNAGLGHGSTASQKHDQSLVDVGLGGNSDYDEDEYFLNDEANGRYASTRGRGHSVIRLRNGGSSEYENKGESLTDVNLGSASADGGDNAESEAHGLSLVNVGSSHRSGSAHGKGHSLLNPGLGGNSEFDEENEEAFINRRSYKNSAPSHIKGYSLLHLGLGESSELEENEQSLVDVGLGQRSASSHGRGHSLLNLELGSSSELGGNKHSLLNIGLDQNSESAQDNSLVNIGLGQSIIQGSESKDEFNIEASPKSSKHNDHAESYDLFHEDDAHSTAEFSIHAIKAVYEKVWSVFKKIFKKHYTKEQEAKRRRQLEKTMIDIFMHNSLADMGVLAYRIGLNEFSDLSPEEFVRSRTGYINYEPAKGRRGRISNWTRRNQNQNLRAPTSLDLRDQGLVSQVRDQGDCGSCWAFSAVAALEAQHMKKTGKMVLLSEQNLVDCSRNGGNSGCDGGWMNAAFDYIINNNGIDTEDTYPYERRQRSCRFNRNNVGATMSRHVDVPEGDETELLNALAAVGPISVAIDGGLSTYQNYKSGIYYDPQCSARRLNHAVTLIGYGTEDGRDYWLIKNSWGTSWGIQGYGKMSRNRNNNCGIASKASYPEV